MGKLRWGVFGTGYVARKFALGLRASPGAGVYEFFCGVAEMAEAIESKRRCHIPADFVLHVNELTLAMQNAGEQGKPYELTTNFEPLQLRQASLLSGHHYGEDSRNFLTATIEKVIQRLHRH